MLKTVDIHTHLLNPGAGFERMFDRLAVRFFAHRLGASAERLRTDPHEAYVEAMARAVRESRHVEKACLFGVDSRVDERGREAGRDGTICAATTDVLAVAARYPDLFIPFLSVNPRRPQALDLIDEYEERGCRGAKCLQNYWGLDLNDERFIPYYEKLRQKRLPLIIHVGGEYAVASDRRYEGVGMLDLALATGVTVIAAHMGLGHAPYKLRFWRNLSREPRYFDQDYFLLLEKLERHERLYADISAILAPLRARALRHLAGRRDIHHKLLFGTDYPVPFPIKCNTYDLSWAARKRIDALANPFDRYLAAMLEYFPRESPVYGNYRKVLPEKRRP